MRQLFRIAIGLVVILLMVGCTDREVVSSNSSGDDGESASHGANHDHDDNHGHGPDPDAESRPVSEVTGSWRIARSENDAPLAYVELFGIDDEPGHFGNYIMGLEPARMLDGNRGDLIGGAWDGETLTVEWNPTGQSSERYTVTTTERIDDDTMKGTFQAENAPFEFEVTVQRMVFD